MLYSERSGFLIRLDIQNLFAIVKSANFANAMILNECVASRVGAFRNAGQSELAVVGTAFVSAGFGNLLLRYCHVYTSSFDHARNGAMSVIFMRSCLVRFIIGSPFVFREDRPTRVDLTVGASAFAQSKRFPAFRAKPQTIGRAKDAHRKS